MPVDGGDIDTYEQMDRCMVMLLTLVMLVPGKDEFIFTFSEFHSCW